MRCESINFCVRILALVLVASSSGEYANEDEPPCLENCYSTRLSLNEQRNTEQRNECLKAYIEFYSYKLVKSMFNFAKTSVYAGLWVNRYEYSDDNLFGNIINETLAKYNNSDILGTLKFEDLNQTVRYVYEQLKYLTIRRNEILVKYDSYPVLQCPTPCSYELVTWQTLFYLALTIFILALITVLLYSIFLRKQYIQLKARSKNLKYAKVES